ncbi:CinA family protein [Bordetella holmesii]|uniref:Competence/damage-inducible protein CinA n=2 Tax=Bordetella holmesii TaxID=35814 RepID=A0A158M1H6_9BORD|nr:CinA family protein [Bordetella holmesii]AHV94560.1 competence/damage-inducible CinA C-terminal domain protein [Bordetella holmesii ATCC 51541]AIT25067.1 competence/damage-inducible CinA C-terminal domain protein [Bordetella holmesii 44057]EWM45631.1 competence/damage-inducible CinA C-terminal domain protein [Bordetella holmesii 70147]EWM48802.1 competence/damage-inducible CinA C-terminal domain protein [Bordetella holmesii 41130]EWM49753.1 competence/damage-inducible CinA C-terminal domain
MSLQNNMGLAPAALSAATAMGLAEQLGPVLQEQGWYLGTAESCTGGLLSAAITSVAGSSGWFERGFVTYSNAAKVDALRVSADTLNHFGAVSEEVALEMAQGVLLAAPACHVSIFTTGIAGPGGATTGKPVGMVCFGFATRAQEGIHSRAVTHVFAGDRSQVRQAAVEFALRGLLEFLGAPANRC